jgi:hypothetical protein
MSNYFFTSDQQALLGDVPKYFYGIRRTEEGSLYFVRVNQLNNSETVEINVAGPLEDNFEEYEAGIDFYEGRDVNHDIVYANLKYEQYRWDNRSVYYYINDNGELILRINQSYTYPVGI